MLRISITIPRDLAARLHPLKDRINVSQVCRDALESRIATFEMATDATEDDMDLKSLASRLREERRSAEGKWEKLGMHNAAAWLKVGSYLELKRVIDSGKPSSMSKLKLPRAAHRTMKHDLGGAANGSWDVGPAVAYKAAWLEYVHAVWAEVEREVEDTKEAPQTEAVAALSTP